MRALRLFFVIALAVLLIVLAMANRQIVTVSLFPANLDQYLGAHWSIGIPLFLVVIFAFALGLAGGLIWEYLREAHIRREARRRAEEVTRLEREVGILRKDVVAPRDDVLMILDEPRPPRSSAATLAAPR